MANRQIPTTDEVAAKESTLEDEVRVALSQCLTETQTSERAPRGFDDDLESLALQDPICSTFLSAGFLPWYAYRRAVVQNVAIKKYASQLSPSRLEHVVAEISAVAVNPDLLGRLRQAIHHTTRSPARYRLLESFDVRLPPELEALETNTHGQKRRRLERTPQTPPRQTDPAQPLVPNVMTEEAPELSDFEAPGQRNRLGEGQPNAAPFPTFDGGHCFVSPAAKNLPFVFPQNACPMLVKWENKASIMVSFPPDPALCCLIMDIAAPEIQHVARELFGVRLRTESGRRTIVFDGGVIVDINESVVFRGAESLAWDKLFGQRISDGLRRSPRRLEELSNGELRSNCSIMEAWGPIDHAARLTLWMNATDLTLIYDELWKA